MRLLVLCLFIITSGCASSQEVWSNKSRILPDELRNIPDIIHIHHSPNPNYAEPNTDKKTSDTDYVWKHMTTVISPIHSLEVIKAGSYIWYSEKGWQLNAQYDKKQFSNRFNCSKGQLVKGTAYTFEKNYRWGNQLYGGDALWYVLAKDKDGTIYKGIGLIETEGQLISTLK